MPNSLQPHGLGPVRLLCPWNSPGKNTEVGSHSLLQDIFPTQGSNPGLPYSRQILYHQQRINWIKPKKIQTPSRKLQGFTWSNNHPNLGVFLKISLAYPSASLSPTFEHIKPIPLHGLHKAFPLCSLIPQSFILYCTSFKSLFKYCLFRNGHLHHIKKQLQSTQHWTLLAGFILPHGTCYYLGILLCIVFLPYREGSENWGLFCFFFTASFPGLRNIVYIMSTQKILLN